jgi:hypothetical protein
MQPRRKVEGIDAELDLAPTSHVSVNVAIAVPSAAPQRRQGCCAPPWCDRT